MAISPASLASIQPFAVMLIVPPQTASQAACADDDFERTHALNERVHVTHAIEGSVLVLARPRRVNELCYRSLKSVCGSLLDQTHHTILEVEAVRKQKICSALTCSQGFCVSVHAVWGCRTFRGDVCERCCRACRRAANRGCLMEAHATAASGDPRSTP